MHGQLKMPNGLGNVFFGISQIESGKSLSHYFILISHQTQLLNPGFQEFELILYIFLKIERITGWTGIMY